MFSYTTYDDTQLVRLLKESDEAAFTELYHRYWRKLYYKAGKKLGDLHEAENVVQNLFLDLWKRRERLEITGTPEHYFAVALKYRILNFQNREAKKISRHVPLSDLRETAERTTEEWLAYSELNRRASELVTRLPEKCQLAFRLREKGLSQQEIAKEMSVSEKTVETHIGRALKAIRGGLASFFSIFF